MPVEAGQAIRKDNLYPPYAYDKEGELLRFAYARALWSAPGMDELITGMNNSTQLPLLLEKFKGESKSI